MRAAVRTATACSMTHTAAAYQLWLTPVWGSVEWRRARPLERVSPLSRIRVGQLVQMPPFEPTYRVF
jgi:hypothetical protein